MKKLIALVCLIGLVASGCLYKYPGTKYESAVPVGGYLTSSVAHVVGAITLAQGIHQDNQDKLAAGYGLLTAGLAILIWSLSYQSFSEYKAGTSDSMTSIPK